MNIPTSLRQAKKKQTKPTNEENKQKQTPEVLLLKGGKLRPLPRPHTPTLKLTLPRCTAAATETVRKRERETKRERGP